MKKALLGLTGALLATSAFTAANAAVISPSGASGTPYTAANAIRVGMEFVTPGTTEIGDTAAADTWLTVGLSSVIGGAQAATFAVRLNVTGATWKAPTTIVATPLSANAAVAGATCATFLSSATQLVFTCTVPAGKTVNGIGIDGAAAADTIFVTAAGTAVGSNIQVDAKISPDTNFLSDSEAPAPATTVVTFVDSAVASFTANTTRSIQQTPVAPGTVDFNSLNASLGPASATSLATVRYALNNPAGVTAAVRPDVVTAVAAGDLTTAAGSAVLVLNSGLFAEAAVTAVTLSGGVATRTKAANPTAFSGSTVTFNLSNAEIDALIGLGLAGAEIRLTLSGTASVPNTAAGTATLDVATAAPFVSDEALVNGTLAAATRGGFTAHFNNFYTLTSAYESFVRIVNPTGTAGTAQLRVWDAGTGALVCTATTPSIASQSTLEANRATIVSLCGAQLPATLPTYLNAEVSGQFNGYAQHVVWNNRATVTDLSGRRN